MSDEKQETLDELEALVVTGSWGELYPYFQKGKLLICQPDTNMVEIGAMLVLDNDEKLRKLAEIGAITPPTNESIMDWSEISEQNIFNFLEIPPYCLAQLNKEGKKRGPL